MEKQKVFAGKTEAEVWKQIEADLNSDQDIYDYSAIIEQDGKKVDLIIEIDLGGGFEGGYENTAFSAVIADPKGFKFAVHRDGFIDDIGKFLGMQDVEVGYTDLDKHLVIKTNDETKVKALFSHKHVREVFDKLEDFDFGIHLHSVEHSDHKHAFLELNIEDGITEPAELRKLYSAFYSVLETIDNFKEDTISSD
ncbi:hypothetical protein BEL04_04365 [Mucilaginibacter sp. PPCGB 2223]|uniref:hypothetical protein n=1 Tax=Mucilaginibacter sp. PPCGB 2223 TaxID=1886027 RepID=UPI0008246EC7|nr:hypothetical protein [Mucilaginibacter sp. PPCGB 2223]OCX53539.1 hypothetical protein BEL04_04365 [Mucilaginibacter sp. PPCGB 2223]